MRFSFSFLLILSTAVSCHDGARAVDVGVGALQSIAALAIASASAARLRFCTVILMRLEGASSGAHGRMFFPTAFGFEGFAGEGVGGGGGLTLTRLGLGMLSLQFVWTMAPCSSISSVVQLFA